MWWLNTGFSTVATRSVATVVTPPTVPPVSTDSLPKDLSTKRRGADSVTPQRGEGGGRMMRNTEGTVHLWLWAV